MLAASREMFPVIYTVGNTVAVATVPRVNVVPAAIVIVPPAFPTIWNPPSLNEVVPERVRFPLTAVFANNVVVPMPETVRLLYVKSVTFCEPVPL